VKGLYGQLDQVRNQVAPVRIFTFSGGPAANASVALELRRVRSRGSRHERRQEAFVEGSATQRVRRDKTNPCCRKHRYLGDGRGIPPALP